MKYELGQPGLEEVGDLHALTTAWQISIHDNEALARITAFTGLQAAGSIEIDANPVLHDISGLATLTSLQGNLKISDAGGLGDLSALSALRAIEGSLRLEENLRLTDLGGLHGLEGIDGDPIIHDNQILPEQEVDDLLEAIGEDNVGGNVSVANNGP